MTYSSFYKEHYLSTRGHKQAKKRAVVNLLDEHGEMRFKELKQHIPALSHTHVNELIIEEEIERDGWEYKMIGDM